MAWELISQPANQSKSGPGPKPVKLELSKSFPVCLRQRTFDRRDGAAKSYGLLRGVRINPSKIGRSELNKNGHFFAAILRTKIRSYFPTRCDTL